MFELHIHEYSQTRHQFSYYLNLTFKLIYFQILSQSNKILKYNQRRFSS